MNENGGFTLIELILVMVIIGILAGAVTLGVSNRGTQARNTRAEADLSVYQTAIDMFALENNDQYPSSLDDLVGGKRDYVREVKPDPWGNPYVYNVTKGKKHAYELYSKGADAQAGTEDDVSAWDD